MRLTLIKRYLLMMENLLSEGRYDKVTTELSREIIEAVKNGKKRIQTRILLFTRTFVDISVYFHYSDDNEPQVYGSMYPKASDIRKHYRGMKIIFHVDAPKDINLRMQSLSELVPEVKNIVRHEIEHVTQTKIKEKEREGFFSSKRRYPEDIEYWEYLTEPYEVEAYVRGLYKKAKTLKQPLNVLFQAWWEYLQSTNMHADEINKVKSKWTEYARKHLPQNELRRYGYIEEPFQPVNEDSYRTVGFKYKEPHVKCAINFNAPPESGNLKYRIIDILDSLNVKYTSVNGGNNNLNSYRIELKLYDEKECKSVADSINLKMMLKDTRLDDITNSILRESEIIESGLLFEAKKDTLRSKYSSIPDEFFNMIVNGDPSPTKKYSEWMLKQYSPIPGEIDRLINIVNRFDKSVNRINHEFIRKGIDQFESEVGIDIPFKDIDIILRSPKDINSYAGVGILNAILNQIESKKTKREEKLVGAEKIYEDENFLVVLPKTTQGSCHYGAGTKWCTAARGENHFDSYSRRGTLYYIIFKANSVLSPERRAKEVWQQRLPKYEKIARFIPNGLEYGTHGEFFDSEDNQVDEDKILNGLFGVTWSPLSMGDMITNIPKGTKPFYDSFYKAWTRIDTHYAKNGMQKPNTYGMGDYDNDWADEFDDWD